MATDSAAIAKAAAHEAVRETFQKLGVDTDDQESVDAFRDDLRFARTIRQKAGMGIDAIVKVVFVAIASAIAGAVAKYLHIGPTP
jgi:hypothetical protein